MALPPAHRVNHAPILIPSLDAAWDNEKIEADKAAIKAAKGKHPEWPEASDHPTARYWNGESRYDEATIRPWLLADVEPTRFTLRRLDQDEIDEADRLVEVGLQQRATTYCFRRGIVSVTNLDGDPVPAAPLSKDQDRELLDRIGKLARTEVAVAVYRVSQVTLNIAEKKP